MTKKKQQAHNYNNQKKALDKLRNKIYNSKRQRV